MVCNPIVYRHECKASVAPATGHDARAGLIPNQTGSSIKKRTISKTRSNKKLNDLTVVHVGISYVYEHLV